MSADWRYAQVSFQVAVAPGRDWDEAIDDLAGELEHGVQQTRLDYTDIRIEEVTSVNDPGTEAAQVAAEQDAAAEASQDETDAILADPHTMAAIAEGDEHAHEANPF